MNSDAEQLLKTKKRNRHDGYLKYFAFFCLFLCCNKMFAVSRGGGKQINKNKLSQVSVHPESWKVPQNQNQQLKEAESSTELLIRAT